jgi:tellurite resistance protein TehA-like permease
MGFLAAFFAPELRAWRGEMQLWKVYWGYGVLGSAALSVVFLAAMREGQRLLQHAILLALALYTVWIVVSVWRCAAHVGPFWRLLARITTIAWACNAALVLSFLESDLIARQAR